MTKIKIEEIVVEITPDGRLDIQNTAKFIGISKHSLFKFKNRKDYPPYTIIANKRFYYIDDLLVWLEMHPKYNLIPSNK